MASTHATVVVHMKRVAAGVFEESTATLAEIGVIPEVHDGILARIEALMDDVRRVSDRLRHGTSASSNCASWREATMDEHIEKIVAQMVKYPANFGHHCELPLYKPGGYGNTGISINRDSEALERSNWRVIVQNLFERFPQMDWLRCSALDFKCDDRPPFVIIESRHWAVGWVNELLVDTQNEEAVLAVLAWADRLADYPVADDMDYSQEQMMEDWDNEQTDKDWEKRQ